MKLGLTGITHTNSMIYISGAQCNLVHCSSSSVARNIQHRRVSSYTLPLPSPVLSPSALQASPPLLLLHAILPLMVVSADLEPHREEH